MKWSVALPPGYDFQNGIENTSASGPEGMSGSVTCAKTGSSLNVIAEVRFPSILIAQPKFGELMGFMDKIETALGKDLVLKKL